jgi:hypothetical protein
MRNRISNDVALKKTEIGEKKLVSILEQTKLPFLKNDGLFLAKRLYPWTSYDPFNNRVTYSVFYQDVANEHNIGRLQVHLATNKTFNKSSKIKNGLMYFKFGYMANEIDSMINDILAYYTFEEDEMLFVPIRYLVGYLKKLDRKIDSAIRAYPLNSDKLRHETRRLREDESNVTNVSHNGANIAFKHQNEFRITPKEFISNLEPNQLNGTNKLKIKTMSRILGGKNV